MLRTIFRTALLAGSLLNLATAQSTTATTTTTSAASTATACNNSPALCNRAYNNITQLGAHDSPFVRDASTSYSISGNQYYNTTVQLSAGVRLLTAQVHNTNTSAPATGEWHVCHSSCQLLDAGRLRTWLGEIKTWLDGNPSEVVTLLLVNSDSASAASLAAEFDAAAIVPYAYVPPSLSTAPTVWPTLASLIANNTRLLAFVADLPPAAAAAPYLMNEFTFIFENAYDNTSPANFSCAASRPTSYANNAGAALSAGLMPLQNHFLYATEAFGIEVPDTAALNNTNAPSGAVGNLGDAAKACSGAYGRAPTFLLVDFFNVGPAIATVDALNGVARAVGRSGAGTSAAQAPVSSSAGASASASASASGGGSARGWERMAWTGALIATVAAAIA
ncbi:hypothetical protein B0A49_04698 [Cryomyces minteri]|uniref:Phosphatidylinositol-specific phospholipase C X domain-containing protein n=1 Tax=Cryomyces minteri TaxID=331657 RepID=A0A4U0XQI6_9PEZI|nr:hypothetical protein B0A49_04698 [Cryomyces minteri]